MIEPSEILNPPACDRIAAVLNALEERTQRADVVFAHPLLLWLSQTDAMLLAVSAMATGGMDGYQALEMGMDRFFSSAALAAECFGEQPFDSRPSAEEVVNQLFKAWGVKSQG